MPQPAKPPPPKKPSGPGYAPPPPRLWMGCLLVLGGIGATTLLLCGGALWYTDSITQSIHDSIHISLEHFGTDLVAAILKASVEGSELPAEDKQVVIAQLDRVTDGVKQNLITSEEQGEIIERASKSPLFLTMVSYGVTYEFRKRSGFDQEEQRQAERTVQRIARGSTEGEIMNEDLQPLLSTFFQNLHPPPQPIPPAQAQQPFSDEDVEKLLHDLKKLADEQGIPDEPYELKVGKEVKRIVDEVLAESCRQR